MRRIRKGQYGFPVITVSPKEYLDKGAEVILKAMEPIGKAISKTLSSPQWGGSSAQMNYARNATLARALAKRASAREKAFEEKVGPALSPSNHVIAWTQGSWNPKVGQLKIAEWGPLALLGSLGVDAMGFKYVPKGVKATTKNGKAYVISKSIDKAVKKGQPKVKQSVNTELFLKPLRSNKQLRVVSEGTYPMYRGKQHSVKEVVNPDGTVNPRQAMRILHEVSKLFPGSHKMEHRLENPEWHKTDPTTYDHTKNVALSAWGLDVPYGFTKHDLMVAALGHDFGKIVAGDGHAQIGADLAKQVFPDLTDAQYTAIAEHMGTPKTSLGKATKAADIDNGRSVGLNSSPLTDTYVETYKLNNSVEPTFDRSKLGRMIGRGAEQRVYDGGNGYVYKVYGKDVPNSTIKDLRGMIDTYSLRNNVDINLPVSYEGYILNNKGQYLPVFKLKKVTIPQKEDYPLVIDMMLKRRKLLGYDLTADVLHNKNYGVFDLHPANFGIDNGLIVVVDGVTIPRIPETGLFNENLPGISKAVKSNIRYINKYAKEWENSIDTNPTEINISPQELYKALRELEGYYFLGHGTGRTGVNPQTIFDSGLRVKGGDITNTTMPISESNLTSWPHMNSEEIIIMPGKAAMTKYDSAHGHIPSDWYSDLVFHWTDNPKKVGSGPFAAYEPNASFTEQTIGGVPGVYTKPEAVLGSYNTKTHTLRLNPNSQYKFTFKPLNRLSLIYTGERPPEYPQFVKDLGGRYKKGGAKIEDYNPSEGIEFPVGFTPLFKMWPGRVLKAHGREIIRRMEPYIDVDKTMGELPLVGKGSIREIVTKNSEIPSYMGYFNKPGTLGMYNSRTGRTLVDPSPANKTVSAMHHERNMHGTDRLLTPEMWKPYEDLIKGNFYNNEPIFFTRAFPDGKVRLMTYDKDGMEIAISKGALDKEELRSTLGEYRKQLYEREAYPRAKADNPDVEMKDLETQRPYFELVVDNLTLSKARDDLKGINSYGKAYAATAHNNKEFLSLLRDILKYSPAMIPFVFPWMVDKKKKGGKTHKPSQGSIHRPWGHRSILDNGWLSTKQLKNKKNVYGK